MGLCLAYQLADRGGDGSPSCSRIRLPSEKRPFSILLPPTFHREPRQRGTGSPSPNVLRPTDYLISKGGECMLTNLLYRAASKFRFHAPSTVTTLAYMAYRASGAYLQDGLFTVHNSDFRKNQKFGAAYSLGKATG